MAKKAKGKWTPEMVKNMAANPVYAGIGPYPPIVTDDLWIGAGEKLIREIGPREWLTRLLRSLREALPTNVPEVIARMGSPVLPEEVGEVGDATGHLQTSEAELDDLADALFNPPEAVSVETAMHTFAAACGPEDFAQVGGLIARRLRHLAGEAAVEVLDADVPGCKLSFQRTKDRLRLLLRGIEEAERIVADGGPGPQGYPKPDPEDIEEEKRWQ